jgi:hypothetical protein
VLTMLAVEIRASIAGRELVASWPCVAEGGLDIAKGVYGKWLVTDHQVQRWTLV